MIKINGKKVSKNQAKKILDDDKTIVKKASIEIKNPNKDKNTPLSYEGFNMDAEFFGALAKKKDKSNASIIAATFLNSSKINNNSVSILVFKPDELTPEEIQACKLLGINLK